MYRATVLVISKRRELGVKYKKLISALGHDVFLANAMSDAFCQIQMKEPELIIISDTIGEKLSAVCRQIRVLTLGLRPIILAVSKSSELEDRLETLESGADDFLSESMPQKELQARFGAHLRRYVESNLNPSTLYVENNLTVKTLKRALKTDARGLSALLTDVSGLNFYREIYGEIAYEKVLQTVGAIIKSTLAEGDFVGHYSREEFLTLAPTIRAERMGSFIAFAFDNIKERFYSEFDFKNGFMLFSASEKIESKIPLMKLAVGVVALDGLEGHQKALNTLFGLVKLSKNSENSCCMVDRPKLHGKASAVAPKNKILILERDEALLCLLQTTCQMRGMELCENAHCAPDVVIIDYQNGEGLELCRALRESGTFFGKIIFTSSEHKKKEILAAGADLYLPKPYDIKVMAKWIEEFLQ
jgi:DNA-binding response OmpR family regulator